MENTRSKNILAAGLLAAALQFSQVSSQAVITGPYTVDGNTLHLWHMDAGAVPIPDAVTSGGTNLVKVGNGATLGNSSYPGFTNALSTIDGGQDGVLAANKDAYLTASSAATPGNVAITLADPASGAFTFEALVWIGFDPAKNFGSVASGGNGRTNLCQIMTGEGTANANRLFQWRIAPIGTDASFNTSVNLEFANVHLAVNNQAITMAIPTTGPDAIASNNWYHVAVVYNGSENTADNLAFYWTLLDPSRTTASLLGTSSMQFDLPVAQTCLAFGALAGRSPIIGNFLGLIDEVRISKIARDPTDMMFSVTTFAPSITTQPADQIVAVGQSASFSVTAGGTGPLAYQWRQSGTNVSGATQAAYSIASAQFTNAGPYDVVVTNASGSVTSSVANLTVRTPANLTWLGLASSNWNTNEVDWITDTSTNVAYTPGDNVTFDNSGSAASTVNLTGPMTPSAVVVNAANDYTFNSSTNGGIVGVSRLTKSGAGALILDTDNSYNGPTVIQGGILQLGAADAHGTLGTGPVTNNSAIVVNRTGNLSFNNTLAGTGSLTNLLTANISISGANSLSGPIVLNGGTLALVGLPARGNTTNYILNASANSAGATGLTLSGGLTLDTNVSLSMLGTVDVPTDFRCNLTSGNGATTNAVNGPITMTGDGSIQFITGASSELDINSSITQPAYTGKLVLRGTGVGHIYGTINLPAANHISTTDGGTWVLHSTGNSWTNSNLAQGTFRLAANNAMPAGVYVQLGGTLDLAGFNQTIGGLTNVGTITNSSAISDCTLTVNATQPSSFFGVIKDSALNGGVGVGKVGLTVTGGTLTLAGVNVYAGDTAISGGTLALSGAGTLNSTNGNIIIGSGAAFDVLGVTSPPYNMRTHKTLIGGGVSGGATINGALTLNGGSFLTLNYASGTPAINVTGGALTLNANLTTVTVSGPALGVGSYKLISASAGGSVTGTLPPSVTVGGNGIAAGTTASLRVTSGEMWLDVISPQSPLITATRFDGANLIFSGTNGTAGNTYYVLVSTNLAGPPSNWLPVFTNIFDVNGAFSVTNAVSPAVPVRFFKLQLQ